MNSFIINSRSRLSSACVKTLCVLLAPLLFSACTTLKPPSPDKGPTLASHWSFSGKAALKDLRGKPKAKSAFINWRQQGEDYHVSLHGPFGQGRVVIERKAEQVRLQHGKTERVAESPEALLYEMTGVHMPVTWLQWWVQGTLAPVDAASVTKDAFGRVLGATQGQWSLAFSKYADDSPNARPHRVVIQHPDYSVKLVIKRWH